MSTSNAIKPEKAWVGCRPDTYPPNHLLPGKEKHYPNSRTILTPEDIQAADGAVT